MQNRPARSLLESLSSRDPFAQVHFQRTRRSQKYPFMKQGPNKILSLLLTSTPPVDNVHYIRVIRHAMAARNERLPIITSQLLIRQRAGNSPMMAKLLDVVDNAEWRKRLNSLAAKGWSSDVIDHWAWILSGNNGDERVERFVSSDSPKPLFILFAILRRNETFSTGKSLQALIDYVRRVYISPYSSPESIDFELDREVSTPDQRFAMHATKFKLFIRRVVFHTQRVQPEALVLVARLTEAYIVTLPEGPSHRRKSKDIYHEQCLVFNAALTYFRLPASGKPLMNRAYNWQAQRTLLGMSDSMDNPLIIDRQSYRAIRQVLIGLRKSKAENAVAARYSSSWPPYRQDFDYMDTKRTPEDDQSRSVKAGRLMREAGYLEDDYDHALDILGGTSSESPTIQTRSIPPRPSDERSQNFYLAWAAKVRATRNPQEAWNALRTYSNEKDRPNIQVYVQMFEKLLAGQISPRTRKVLPGDLKESFPEQHSNLSEFERARLQPPTVEELYQQMLHDGIRPEGYCLALLLTKARSLAEAHGYLNDSNLDPVVKSTLNMYKLPAYQIVRKIPRLIFTAYIELLCQLQPLRRWSRGRPRFQDSMYIQHAIRLAKVRLFRGTIEGATCTRPWHYILKALARPYISVSTYPIARNDAVSLELFVQVFNLAKASCGVDDEMLIHFSQILQKVCRSRLGLAMSTEDDPVRHDTDDTHVVLSNAHSNLKACFRNMLLDVESTVDMDKSIMHHVNSALFHEYMRAMAFLHDNDEMAYIMNWMLQNRASFGEEVELKGDQTYENTRKALCAFCAFSTPIPSDVIEDLELRFMEASQGLYPWNWPSDEEVEDYVQSDPRSGSPRLREYNRALVEKH